MVTEEEPSNLMVPLTQRKDSVCTEIGKEDGGSSLCQGGTHLSHHPQFINQEFGKGAWKYSLLGAGFMGVQSGGQTRAQKGPILGLVLAVTILKFLIF